MTSTIIHYTLIIGTLTVDLSEEAYFLTPLAAIFIS